MLVGGENMNYLVLIILGLLEQIIVMILCKELAYVEYEEIAINYSIFRFKAKENGRYGINMLIRTLFPVCFIIIVAGIFYNNNLDQYVNNIYVVTITFYLFRWANIAIIQRRGLLHYWRREFFCFILALSLSVVVYYTFITKTREIFMPIEALRDAIWFAIISLMVGLIWNISKRRFSENQEIQVSIRERYIYSYLNKFKKRYKISNKNPDLEYLIYAVMIYENYNRPPFIRFFEYIKCLLCGHATLGVMQVSTNSLISNKQSVVKGVEILKNNYDEHNNDIEKTIGSYNKGDKYKEEVLYIYNVIKNYYKKIK